MIITKLEELEKGKVKVYVDEEYHFLLYQKDIKIYQLNENEEISDIRYNDILINTVLRRAKQKALSILKFMDRTEQELIIKLRQADYTDSVIFTVVDYVKNYHYIDDARYTVDYVRSKKHSKSKRQLQSELMYKGIDKELIVQALEDEYEDEDASIRVAIAKKCRDVDSLTQEDKVKLSSYLYRKGFTVDLIKKYVN